MLANGFNWQRYRILFTNGVEVGDLDHRHLEPVGKTAKRLAKQKWPSMPALVLGPLLRHVSTTTATVWVEVDEACTVEVLGHATRTFCVHGHHYALVVVEGLEPGSTTPYRVELDGASAWPLVGSPFPDSTIRTLNGEGPLRVLFGSCRASAPHHPPHDLEPGRDPRQHGVDALRAHGLRMLGQPPSEWPHLIVCLGDQIYADDPSPKAQRRMKRRRRRRHEEAPDDVAADFEEYRNLYLEAWTPDVERWLLSVVPSTMIFDDHDMIDDWNISRGSTTSAPSRGGTSTSSAGWCRTGSTSTSGISIPTASRRRACSPRCSEDDGEPALRRWAEESEEFTPVPGGYHFSFMRDLGRTTLVVLDCRNGRDLEPGARRMIGGRRMGLDHRTVPPATRTTFSSPRRCPCTCPVACTDCSSGTKRCARERGDGRSPG